MGTKTNDKKKDIGKVLSSGSGQIRKKIRDVERSLKRGNLKADMKTDHERTLLALKAQLNMNQGTTKVKKNAKKYHMVRFFERKKAIRRLKQARKHLEEVQATDIRKDIKKAKIVVKHKEIDVAYTILFPKAEKYISLYPNTKPEDVNKMSASAKKGIQQTEQRRIEFRKEMESLILQQKLPFDLEVAVAGKAITINEGIYRGNQELEEIDAPRGKGKEKENEKENENEDEFFEES